MRPCCDGTSCAVGPNQGWKLSAKTKQALLGKKRKAVPMDIDLATFKPRPIGNTPEALTNWLADSKPAWDPLRIRLLINRQKKKLKSVGEM